MDSEEMFIKATRKKMRFPYKGRFIYRENAVMNKGDHFEFMDSGGLWHTIIFQESLAIREDGER